MILDISKLMREKFIYVLPSFKKVCIIVQMKIFKLICCKGGMII